MKEMKKEYKVPQVSFEDFEVNMKIAGVCGDTGWMDDLKDIFNYFNSSEVDCYMFLNESFNPITGEKIDGDYTTFCYSSIGAIHGS